MSSSFAEGHMEVSSNAPRLNGITPRNFAVLNRISLIVLAIAGSTAVQASTVFLQPVGMEFVVGSEIRIDVVIDFEDDPTFGGGLDIVWDPARLAFSGFTFEFTTVFGDPSFQFFGIPSPGRYAEVFNGSFSNSEVTGITGTIFLTAVAGGTTFVDVTESSNPGGFWLNVDTWQQFPEFIGTEIVVRPVPIPPAIVLAMGAFASLGILRRR